MKSILETINERAKVRIDEAKFTKKAQQAILDDMEDEIFDKLSGEIPTDKNKFVWVSPKNADNAVSDFEGRGWTTKTPLKKEDAEKMKKLGSKYGVWLVPSLKVQSYYNKSYNKAFIVVTETQIYEWIGYDGCWTMSGEDYVSGSYRLVEIKKDNQE